MKVTAVLFLLCLSGACAQTPQWEIFEVEVKTSAPLKNPFTDATLDATFRHGDRAIHVAGFYDGEAAGQHVFRVRFAPDETGPWSYRLAANLAELDGRTGSFVALPPISRGGLVRKATFAKSFFRADGSYFYPINYGIFPHPGNKGGSELGPPRTWSFPRETEMNDFIDLIGSHGFNMLMDIRVLYQRQARISDPSFFPPFAVTDPEHWKIDPERFNLAYFQRLDRELARARSRGIFYTLQLITSQFVQQGEFTWSHSFMNVDNGGWLRDRNGDRDGDDENEYYNLDEAEHVRHLEALIRYTLARTAADWNVMYRIGGDTRNPGAGRVLPPELAIRWFSHWKGVLQGNDPYGRPFTLGRTLEKVTNEVGSDWNAIPDWSENEIAELGSPPNAWKDAPLPEVLRAIWRRGAFMWSSPDYSRPAFPYEAPPYFWHRKDFFELERRAYWTALASGYSWARPDSHFEVMVGSPPRLYESVFFKLPGPAPILAVASHLARFMNEAGLPWERMAPLQGVATMAGDAFVRALPGDSYFVFLPFGGTVDLHLSPSRQASYTARFFNPRSGTWLPANHVGSGVVRFAAPDNEDWALVVQRRTNALAKP